MRYIRILGCLFANAKASSVWLSFNMHRCWWLDGLKIVAVRGDLTRFTINACAMVTECGGLLIGENRVYVDTERNIG